LRELVAYWLDGYEWGTHEAAMNAFEQYRTDIDGVPIHFIRTRGVGSDPFPLVLTHGWPWTFWDYRHVIGPLADPVAHGGRAEDAFDVIVPSLPGFGFSGPVRRTDLTHSYTADLWVRLMRDVLGYDRFGAHGGDWGAHVSARLGERHPEHVVGIHVTYPPLLADARASLVSDDYGPDEADWAALTAARAPSIASHVAVQVNDPQTLAFALTDSPVGLAAWLVERRRNWSDCSGDVESRFSKDDLLTMVSLYWFTDTIGSSMRCYADALRNPEPTARVPVPTAVTVFPADVFLLPRRLVERYVNLQRWTVMPSGGHFAPAEEPRACVDDIRAFFAPLRDS
jgi:pimeloyl-ACP methyl ester carboxylesterase